MRALFLILILFCYAPAEAREKPLNEKPLKALHLCFHIGCIREIEGIARELSIDLTSWNIHDLPPYFFDEAVEGGDRLYNIGHDRAKRVWEKHSDFFNQFDLIITSDTTPLARIFIQNGWKKPLIVWVSNRFDWHAAVENPDCSFPDEEYYELLRKAVKRPNVFFVASTPYEIYYANKKNVNIGDRVIQACACYLSKDKEKSDPEKNQQIFIHERTDRVQASNLSDFSFTRYLKEIGFPIASYRYRSIEELQDLGQYKGVLYLPYQWYAISLFETLQLEMPTFIPSEKLLTALIRQGSYFFDGSENLIKENLFSLTEWYKPEVRNIFIYFDHWEDLRLKASLDLGEVRNRMAIYAQQHRQEMLQRWEELFNKVRSQIGLNK